MYQVVWLQTALDELTMIWTQADSTQRQTITTAANKIDQLLDTDPNNQGESRDRGRRFLYIPPLGLTFEVHRQQSTVRVLHVWFVRQRSH
jgi:hypothetical protein